MLAEKSRLAGGKADPKVGEEDMAQRDRRGSLLR
jgi:hypothetical protein